MSHTVKSYILNVLQLFYKSYYLDKWFNYFWNILESENTNSVVEFFIFILKPHTVMLILTPGSELKGIYEILGI